MPITFQLPNDDVEQENIFTKKRKKKIKMGTHIDNKIFFINNFLKHILFISLKF